MSLGLSEISLFKGNSLLTQRTQETKKLGKEYPEKIPVILIRARNCMYCLASQKFLVPIDMTMMEFVGKLRRNLFMPAHHGLYFIVSGNRVPALPVSMGQLYGEHSDEDGFLYILYTDQEDKGVSR